MVEDRVDVANGDDADVGRRASRCPTRGAYLSHQNWSYDDPDSAREAIDGAPE
jgi:hypothetical protein